MGKIFFSFIWACFCSGIIVLGLKFLNQEFSLVENYEWLNAIVTWFNNPEIKLKVFQMALPLDLSLLIFVVLVGVLMFSNWHRWISSKLFELISFGGVVALVIFIASVIGCAVYWLYMTYIQ